MFAISVHDYQGNIDFITFTVESNIVACVWAICVLFKINKKAITLLGNAAITNLLITNIIGWIIFNGVNGLFDNKYYLAIDIMHHVVTFLLTFTLFLLIRSDNVFNEYITPINFKSALLIETVIISTFFIGAICVNFIPHKWTYGSNTDYYTFYGFLTNYNPKNGGSYLVLLTIPAFYLIAYFFDYFFYAINRNFILKNFADKKQFFIYFWHNYLITTLVVSILMFQLLVQTVTNEVIFNVLSYILFGLCALGIGQCSYTIIKTRKNKISNFYTKVSAIILCFLCIICVGAILEVIVSSNLLSAFYGDKQLNNLRYHIGFSCVGYAICATLCSFFSSLTLRNEQISKKL
ncbi:MAG: hypothetical protein LBB95_00250 [Mycoplasmataceae bacterium]|nr:hypothetical protein [Mycoplasmataceae bacterium]